jgi:pentatricopeptide repeat protein
MHLDWTMGIVQAATRLQAAALARQQRIGLLRKIPTLSSCRPFWKYQQQQEPQCHQYELLSLTASTTYPTVEHKRAHHQQQPQPCRSSSNDGSQNVNSSCLAIVLTMYNPIISTQQPAPHLPPIRGMGKALRVAATTPTAARRCFASSSSSLSLPDNGENNSNVVVISESVNDLETKVMRQMAQRLLIQTRHDDDQGKRSANTTTITRYHSHTWFDAEDALKWWASQRTVESVQICFALLDRFVQETAAAAQQQAQQLETDDQQQSPSSSTMNGLAWFLDWRLMGAIMGNWTAVWKECVEDGTTSRSRLELLLTPRVVLERLDRYAQEHAHVTGFGVRASGVILSNVLNVAITQSRSMLGLDGRGGSLATTRPLLGKPPLQPPVTSPATAPASEVATRFQQEQQFSFLTVGNTMNCNSTLINNGENEHDMVEMVQFCTHVLDRLLDEYRHLDNSDGARGTAHQETSIEHRSKKKSNVRKSSVYFCNSLLSLWSHICSRSNTMADLERAVQQAEYVFSMSLNAGASLDIISYNTMLDVYAQAEKGHQAESLLQTMFQNWLFHKEQRQEHHTQSSCEQQDEQYSRDHYVVEPDAISFNTTAAAWARSTPSHEAPERLQALWRAMLDPQHYGQLRACRQGTTSNIFYNTLLLTWAKSGRPDAGEGAEEFLREMILRASLASCPSPSSRLSSSRLHPGSVYDDNEEDEEVSLARKQYEQQQPDIFSYGAVAYAYSRVGRAEDAERIALGL